MGQSPSIEEMQKKDDAFRQYLVGIAADLDAKSAAIQSKMQSDMTAFYTSNNYDDAKDITSGQNTDFQHQSEFSLANLNAVITAISDAVFAGSAPPAGTSVNGDAVKAADKALGAEVGAVSDLALYMAGKVFDVLGSVVLSFGAGTAVSLSTETKSEPLGFGLQLFAAVSAQSYQSHSFFNNDYIYEYVYAFDVKWSLKQQQTEATKGVAQLYTNDLVNFEARESQLADDGAGKIDGNTFETSVAIYDSLIAKYRAMLEALNAKALAAAKAQT